MTEQLAQQLVDLFQNRIPPELTVFIISLFPILELRGGLIAAKLLGLDLIPAFIICYIGNMLPVPFILLFIRRIFQFLRNRRFWKKIIEKLEIRSKRKSESVKRYRGWGLLLFVAIPLPGTGGWTGALIAALADMRVRDATLIIAVGVLIAGLIMSGLSYGLPAVFNMI
ncbi:MAG TPA: small multi-drug export protein [Ruminococcaceae bacterium]|nr:small multi-drug export protein [Oscillospiraceae bacterium]